MKNILQILCLTFCTLALFGQQKEATISFIKEVHNFGDINEVDGKVSCNFEFTNTGSLPLVIYDVRPTCGCTAPKWSKEPVQPGARGFIEATFDPNRRPGKFNKGITVKSNSSSGIVVIRIIGNVIPKPKTIADIYPFLSGNIRLKQSNFALSRVYANEKKTEVFPVVNDSKELTKITFDRVPEHITVRANPAALNPGQEGEIIVTYDASKKDEWDFVLYRIYMLQNGKAYEDNSINIRTTIVENFSGMTAIDSANAPRVSFEKRHYDFGIVPVGAKVEHEFVLKNTGKRDLIIRKVKASCGCTAVEPAKKVISPGKSSNVKAIFNTSGRKGQQSKSITVITNDPFTSRVVLRMKGIVGENH